MASEAISRSAEAVRPTLALPNFHTAFGRGETGEKLGRKPGLRSHCDTIIEGLCAPAPVIFLFARSVECERSNSGEQK